MKTSQFRPDGAMPVDLIQRGDPVHHDHHSILEGVSVILPMYNEEKHIKDVLTHLFATLSSMKIKYEVIVVNDGSTDNCVKIAQGFPVEIISHARNCGYGKAIKSGVHAARYEWVIWLDADGQHPPELIPEMVAQAEGADAVIGIRPLQNSITRLRMVGKAAIRTLAQILLGVNVPDLNCGFRAFRKRILVKYLHLLPDGYSASMTSTLIFYFRGYVIKTLPVQVNISNATSHMDVVKDGLKALNQILRMAMLFAPWRTFGTMGFFFIALGVIYGFWNYFTVAFFPSSAGMCINMGISSIFFGLLMDQISEFRKEQFE
jgi:glycosyltransferase involved in cell wall biosynthesis